jgi:hypothetical protein
MIARNDDMDYRSHEIKFAISFSNVGFECWVDRPFIFSYTFVIYERIKNTQEEPCSPSLRNRY